MNQEPPYTQPIQVEGPGECVFYHTIDLPSLGEQQGLWDLRGKESAYIGGLDLQGKRVLECGCANGHLSFWMEKQGADVVSYDLSPIHSWDLIPHGGAIDEEDHEIRKDYIGKQNKAWWLAHRLNNSQAKAVNGRIYDIPASIGKVDIVTYGSILLHLRDPYAALQAGAVLASETVIVTDCFTPAVKPTLKERLVRKLLQAPPAYQSPMTMKFLPSAAHPKNNDTWWEINPDITRAMLETLGFTRFELTFHRQFQHQHETQAEQDRWVDLFTLVAHRK